MNKNKNKKLNAIYDIIFIIFIAIMWYGLVPSIIFEIESTFIVMGFLLISIVGTVYAGNRIINVASKIGKNVNEN